MARLLHQSHDDLSIRDGARPARSEYHELLVWFSIIGVFLITTLIGLIFSIKWMLVVGLGGVAALIIAIVVTLIYIGLHATPYLNSYDNEEETK